MYLSIKQIEKQSYTFHNHVFLNYNHSDTMHVMVYRFNLVSVAIKVELKNLLMEEFSFIMYSSL